MEQELTMCCSLCSVEKNKPETLEEHIMETAFDYDDCLCSNHASLKKFFSSVCNGCVGSFPVCNLGKAFLFSEKRITANDLQVIQKGKCPFKGQNLLIGCSSATLDGTFGENKPADRESSKSLYKYINSRMKV